MVSTSKFLAQMNRSTDWGKATKGCSALRFGRDNASCHSPGQDADGRRTEAPARSGGWGLILAVRIRLVIHDLYQQPFPDPAPPGRGREQARPHAARAADPPRAPLPSASWCAGTIFQGKIEGWMVAWLLCRELIWIKCNVPRAQLTSVRPCVAERGGPKFHSFPLCLNLPRPVNLGRGVFCRTNGAFALTRRSIMNKLSMLGIIGGAALLAAVPFSLEWSQENVGSAVPLLTVSHADAQTAGMVRRQARRAARTERRQVRRTARTERRAIRRGVAPQ